MQDFRRRLFIPLFLAVFGFVMVQLGYGILKRGNIEFVHHDGQSEIFSTAHGPLVFWAFSWGTFLLGALLIASAVFVFSNLSRLASVAARVQQAIPKPNWPKAVWRMINVAFIVLVFAIFRKSITHV